MSVTSKSTTFEEVERNIETMWSKYGVINSICKSYMNAVAVKFGWSGPVWISSVVAGDVRAVSFWYTAMQITPIDRYKESAEAYAMTSAWLLLCDG